MAEKRICPLCKSGVEDEFHFSIKCIKLSVEREILFKYITDIVPSFSGLPENEKFRFIFSSNDYDISKCCIQCINILYKARSDIILNRVSR